MRCELRCDWDEHRLLLRIISRIAEEAWKDTTLHPIREGDYDALGVGLLKFPLKNEFENGMSQFPLTVRDNVGRGWNSIRILVRICKSIWQLMTLVSGEELPVPR